MKLEFGYGKGSQWVELPEQNLIAQLTAAPMEHPLRGEAAVAYALENPIGAPLLRDAVKPGMKIAIVTSDISRPMPTRKVLPLLLKALHDGGIPDEDITLVFALGSHRNHTREEMEYLAGDSIHKIRCVDSDPEDCVSMGTTSRGTPVDITRSVAEADFRICLGNIEFHYFAGYSGGAKAIMPGVSTHDAIQCNHRMMVDPNACAGKLEGNPIREDIEEAGRICPIHYILNVILDEHKEIVHAVAGHSVLAHRSGCAYLDKMYRCPIPKQADIVLVSQGGAPKDANLYQTQKALDNAKHAVRPGGTVILLGQCQEGMGSATFAQWFQEANSPEDLIRRIGSHFQLGGHKAAAIAMVLANAHISFVSDFSPEFVRSLFMDPYPTAQAALDAAFALYGPDASVIAMPFGGSTLPIYQSGEA